jgi:hypothetical protein
MRGGELAAGEERDRCRKEIVGETTVEERNREGNVHRTVGGGGRAGTEAWKPWMRGSHGVGSCRPGDAHETDAGGG